MPKNSATKQPVDIGLGLASQARLAALFGRSREWVHYLAKRGIIRRVDPGEKSGPNALYDLEDSIRRIAEYLGELGREAPAGRLEAARVRQAELEYGEASGQLHTTASVLAIVGPQHIAFKQRMLGLAPKTARTLAAMTDPVEIQKLLTGEVREALQELRGFRQEDVAARRRQRVKGSGAGVDHE